MVRDSAAAGPWATALQVPEAAGVRLWRIALDRAPEVVARLSGVLDAAEQARARGYRHPRDRDRFIVGRAVMRIVLAEDAPASVRFATGAYGKPELAPARCYFNLSRGSGIAVLATADRPIGIDIEHRRAIPEMKRIAEQVFADAERAWMMAVPDPDRTERFLTLWTRKEALGKAAGLGLSDDLRRFDTLPREDAPTAILAWGERWQIRPLCGLPDHLGAFAIRVDTSNRRTDRPPARYD